MIWALVGIVAWFTLSFVACFGLGRAITLAESKRTKPVETFRPTRRIRPRQAPAQ